MRVIGCLLRRFKQYNNKPYVSSSSVFVSSNSPSPRHLRIHTLTATCLPQTTSKPTLMHRRRATIAPKLPIQPPAHQPPSQAATSKTHLHRHTKSTRRRRNRSIGRRNNPTTRHPFSLANNTSRHLRHRRRHKARTLFSTPPLRISRRGNTRLRLDVSPRCLSTPSSSSTHTTSSSSSKHSTFRHLPSNHSAPRHQTTPALWADPTPHPRPRPAATLPPVTAIITTTTTTAIAATSKKTPAAIATVSAAASALF